MLNRKSWMLIGIAVLGGGIWIHAQKGEVKTLTAQDLVEIQQLYAKYNWTIDAGDGEGYASTFTPDGVFNDFAGHDALVKFANNFHARLGAHLQHWNTNLLIAPTPEGAHGQVYLLLVDFGTQPPTLTKGASYYLDDLVKSGKGWRFTKRTTH